jgi:ABC-type transport system involved in Fe-S cluster assembly fused permease/ATPase subunit
MDNEGNSKLADLLAGDAIINYKTVASFANEDKIVNDYLSLLQGPKAIAIKKAMMIGFAYGFS